MPEVFDVGDDVQDVRFGEEAVGRGDEDGVVEEAEVEEPEGTSEREHIGECGLMYAINSPRWIPAFIKPMTDHETTSVPIHESQAFVYFEIILLGIRR